MKRLGEEGDFKGLLTGPPGLEMVMVEGLCIRLGVREANEPDRRARLVRPISISSSIVKFRYNVFFPTVGK